ncbi:MAG: exonuclease [Deltaproteobacteria bacterium]|nr:exonuclease [Deltaproteobacteria bacterium]
MTDDPFVAIDFETADEGPDSACAVALVRVEDGRLRPVFRRLVRPPRSVFRFTWVHGITWDQVVDQPTFASVWQEAQPMLDGAAFLAAHNAPFDRQVLLACCAAAGLAPPRLPFLCTVRLARAAFGIFPTRLPDVCGRLGIPLVHHDPASDAEACANIVTAARRCEDGRAALARLLAPIDRSGEG